VPSEPRVYKYQRTTAITQISYNLKTHTIRHVPMTNYVLSISCYFTELNYRMLFCQSDTIWLYNIEQTCGSSVYHDLIILAAPYVQHVDI
jgi:hypothetical protein